MRFGELLVELRVKYIKTQAELALSMGVDQTYISKLERGLRVNPSRELIITISQSLGLTLVETNSLLSAAKLFAINDGSARRYSLL